jgi:glycosyltransferase involved in cell wall biosynthesis
LSQVGNNSDVEVLVSDNGSTDNTEQIIQSYLTCFLNLRYYRNETNLGFDGNVIQCIEHAKGDYLSLFSDDDIALPGTFTRIIDELLNTHPVILCVNHHPFQASDPGLHFPDIFPKIDQVFTDGKNYLLFADLGFISSLTFSSEAAKRYIASIEVGLGHAHLEVAIRLALTIEGIFVFLGTISIAARIPETPAYDWFTSGALNKAILYQRLRSEGIIDKFITRRQIDSIIRHNVVRFILFKKCIGDYESLDKEKALIISTFKGYIDFYILVIPILFCPRFLLVGPYVFLRHINRLIKKWRYGKFQKNPLLKGRSA